MNTISVGIVTYNSADKIGALLESIFHYTKGVRAEVFVVDNASSDNTVDLIRTHFPQVHVTASPDNLGFGKAHNLLIDQIDSDYHAIVNPDIRLGGDVLTTLTSYLNQNASVVMVTPRVLNDDATEQYLPKRRPKLRYLFGGRLERFGRPFDRWRAEYTMKNQTIAQPVDIDFCTGCFAVMRTDAFRTLGGFDDRFFMYFEDADLTLRAKQHGRVIFYPDAYVIHEWERASSKSLKFLLLHMKSMFQFFGKWFGKKTYVWNEEKELLK